MAIKHIPPRLGTNTIQQAALNSVHSAAGCVGIAVDFLRDEFPDIAADLADLQETLTRKAKRIEHRCQEASRGR